MHYHKLDSWPFIDPDAPPIDYIKLAESVDRYRSSDNVSAVWHFFYHADHLIICDKVALPYHEKLPSHAISQYEFPIEGARWFVNTVERFLLPPDHPQAVPRGKLTIEEPVAGEVLGVTRGAWFGGAHIPGYSFDNLNRIEHSTLPPDGPTCEMFKMGDPWLFEDGLFDLFKEIAARHEAGEF